MKNIILIRHGAIDAQFAGRYIGATDVPLSTAGFSEALAIGEYIANIPCEDIFASPLRRVRQTLETALGKDKKVQYLDQLREVNFGDWEGKTLVEINEQYPAAVKAWAQSATDFTFPNGSNLKDFYDGIEQFKQLLLAASSSTCMVFTHGGVILALLCNILGLEKNRMLAFRVARGSITTLELFENGSGILTGINIKPQRV